MLAEALAASWVAAFLVASRALPPRLGSHLIGGMERWRDAWAIPTQLVLLPLLFALRGAVADATFTYLFALYMLLDFPLCNLGPMLVAHHVVCLVGHAITTTMLPAGFDTYFFGVVALEAGSGCMNVWLMDYASRWRTAFFAVGMSASNAAALLAAWRWAMLPLPLVPKVVNLLISLPLIALRQKAMLECVREGPEELRDGAAPAAKPGEGSVPPTPDTVRALLWQRHDGGAASRKAAKAA